MGQYTQSGEGTPPWRRRYRPYIVAFTLAFVMTMFIAPEVNEGDAMSPALKDGQVVVIRKTSYSSNRGIPEKDKVIILEKNALKGVTDDNLIARVAGLPGDEVEVGGEKVKVGKEQVYLLCDNKDKMMDSRNKKIGLVDMEQIRGNVKLIIWPLSDIGGVH